MTGKAAHTIYNAIMNAKDGQKICIVGATGHTIITVEKVPNKIRGAEFNFCGVDEAKHMTATEVMERQKQWEKDFQAAIDESVKKHGFISTWLCLNHIFRHSGLY